jgi:hypothetical protein
VPTKEMTMKTKKTMQVPVKKAEGDTELVKSDHPVRGARLFARAD